MILLNLLIISQKIQFDKKIHPDQQQKQLSQIDFLFGYQSYEEIISTFKEWQKAAPDLVYLGNYGKSSQGKDLIYLKIGKEDTNKRSVFITACIHGNEPLATSTIIAVAGKLISSYGVDQSLTKLLDDRILYIIPVVSPDTYPKSRNIEKIDPNRNFPTLSDPNKESVVPIKNLQDFFLKIKPDSVLSGHTFGRLFLIPWGDSYQKNPNDKKYRDIVGRMSELTGYKVQRACEIYSRPIKGTEIDWYHRNGAFAIVMEFGTHQKKPSLDETTYEFNRTFESIVYFIENSVNVEIN